jgi:F-type H+-transporting ATPase subunit b
MKRISAYLAASVFFAPAARAADVEELLEAAGEGLEGEAHTSGGGLPQFDPTWFMSQFFWLVVAFAVLYAIFSRVTLPGISGVIENRRNQIDADLETAEKLTDEADSVHDAYIASLGAAQESARATLQEADDKIKDKAAKKADDFRRRSEEEIQAAEQRIEDAKRAAMADMNRVVAEVAATAVEKITGTQADAAKVQSIVENIDNAKAKAKAA